MKNIFDAAVEELKKFCEENTRFSVEIVENVYPLEVRFYPIQTQMSMFEKKDEPIEKGYVSVICGLEPTVRIGIKLEIGNALLKKLVNKAENVGVLYLHYKCQESVSENKEE